MHFVFILIQIRTTFALSHHLLVSGTSSVYSYTNKKNLCLGLTQLQAIDSTEAKQKARDAQEDDINCTRKYELGSDG